MDTSLLDANKIRFDELVRKIDLLIDAEKDFLPNGSELMIIGKDEPLFNTWQAMKGKYLAFGIIFSSTHLKDHQKKECL